jgi:(p)ppGpp synthase/HD superfamily hydrolase
MSWTPLEDHARLFSMAAHETQKRKYTGEPYHNHLLNVASTCKAALYREEVVAAAFLHDIIEDQGYTVETLSALFGTEVAQLVNEVTDVSKPTDGNRAARKALDRAHLANASPEGMTIKLADIIDNTSSIVKYDPGFARVYLKEKKALLPLLKRGNSTLWQIANDFVEKHS